MTAGGRDEAEEAFFAGFLTGVEHGTATGHAMGHAEGYRAAMTVLDDAGALLAAARPSAGLDMAAARARRTRYATPARTPQQIRVQAAASWGLPVPADIPADIRADIHADVASAAGPAAAAVGEARASEVPAGDVAADVLVEVLVDDDDWAWQG